MKAFERLLNYVKVHTKSDPESDTSPSSSNQFDLAKKLVEELKEIGLTDAKMSDTCYVYATLPATKGYEDKTKLGFIAHMDTAPDFCGENVNPQIIENYDGNDIQLGSSGRTLKVENFPHLRDLKGRTLITTDGTTLLGADDKAGIAEIMTAMEELQKDGAAHGKICVAFTPDEEVGAGTAHFDVEQFGADYAYTLDGGPEGEIQFENFNASEAVVMINGFNVHPGSSKDTMINALLVGMELNSMLPSGDTPRNTKDYEGFFHVCGINGNVEHVKMQIMIRDHDHGTFMARQEMIKHAAQLLNEKYGKETVTVEIKEQYLNMKEKIEPCFHLIETAKKVSEEIGVTPMVVPVRGGTDGAHLSFMGLPCPNLGTGGYAYHGPFEHISVEGMDSTVKAVLGIIREYSK